MARPDANAAPVPRPARPAPPARRLRPPTTAAVLALLPLLACDPVPSEVPPSTPMDGLPASSIASPDGRVRAVIRHGGELTIDGALVHDQAIGPLALSPTGDRLAYARHASADADLYVIDIPAGEPRRVLDWPGAEDRPVFSPDATQLAFVSGRTGIASVWVIDLDTEVTRQLTNLGLEQQPRTPGQAPEGFVPPPQADFAWTAGGLSWTADGQRFEVRP